jgi:hypothetical protein
MEAYDAELAAAESRGNFEDLIDMVERLAKQGTEAESVERKIFSSVLKIGLSQMKAYFAHVGTGDVGGHILKDGQVLRRQKQLQPRDYFSIFGKLEVSRSRYRARVGKSVFPLDAQVNLPERCYSYVIQAMVCRLDADLSFKNGTAYLSEFFGHELSESVFMEIAKDAAKEYEAYYKKRKPPAPKTEGKILVSSFDGKGVPMIRREAEKLKARPGKGEKRQKKKESLVGVCYTVDPNPRTAEDLAESLIDPDTARSRRQEQGNKNRPQKAQNIRRTASLEHSKKEVFLAIHDDAKKRDPECQSALAVLLDGAWVLEDLGREIFTAWAIIFFILDIIHVRDYLWNVANSLYGEKSKDGREWVLEKLTEILRGRVGRVIGGLRQILTKRKESLTDKQQKAIDKTITYFDNHRDMMRYDEFLAQGLPVATSITEGSCGTLVKNRMEGNGRHWGIPGAEAILKLRSLKMSHDNDLVDFARFRAEQERKRLYGENKGFQLGSNLPKAA